MNSGSLIATACTRNRESFSRNRAARASPAGSDFIIRQPSTPSTKIFRPKSRGVEEARTAQRVEPEPADRCQHRGERRRKMRNRLIACQPCLPIPASGQHAARAGDISDGIVREAQPLGRGLQDEQDPQDGQQAQDHERDEAVAQANCHAQNEQLVWCIRRPRAGQRPSFLAKQVTLLFQVVDDLARHSLPESAP